MFRIGWISQASAEQRAGRAGRTSTGWVYRLYSSAVFANDMPRFEQAEVQRRPVLDILLTMKAIGIPRVVNFPFPSPPDELTLKSGETILYQLGAITNPVVEQSKRKSKLKAKDLKLLEYRVVLLKCRVLG